MSVAETFGAGSEEDLRFAVSDSFALMGRDRILTFL